MKMKMHDHAWRSNRLQESHRRESTPCGDAIRRLRAARPVFILLASMALGTPVMGAASSQDEPNRPSDAASVLRSAVAGGTEAAKLPPAQRTTRRLWQSRVSAPRLDENADAQITLDDLIEKIRSVRFEQKEPVVTASTPAEATAARQEIDVAPAPRGPASQRAERLIASPAKPPESLPPEAREVLQHLLSEPNQVSNPLELGELLFLSGRITEASVFYQTALDRATAAMPAAREDRAWILLQLGNCLRETDVTRAQNMYSRLITEHGDSPWVEVAKANSQLLAWYERVQPRQWIESREPEPAGPATASQKAAP
jgi:hypothetical protein